MASISLRNKTIVVLGLALFLTFSIFAVISLFIALGGLQELEAREVGKGISQAEYTIDNERHLLEGTAEDWSWWDDPYWYIQGKNPDFIKNNVNPSSLANLNVHLVVFLNGSGSVLDSGMFLPESEEIGTVPAEIFDAIDKNPDMLQQSVARSGSGIILLPDGPMVVAFSPVMNSSVTSAAVGTLIMGRYLNAGQFATYSRIIGYPVDAYWRGEPGLNDERRSLLDDPMTGGYSVRVHPENNTVSGYTRITDMNGRNILLGIDVPRAGFNQGMRTVLLMLALFAGFAIVTVLMLTVILDRTVLRRMSMLTGSVNTLDSGEPSTLSPVLTGNDELTQLEQAILIRHRDLALSRERLRGFIDALRDPAMLLTPDGTILLANRAFARDSGIPAEKIAGTRLSEMPGKLGGLVSRHLKEIAGTKTRTYFEENLEGRNIFVSGYPVVDAMGNVAQVAVLAVDTSELKRIETALAKATKRINVLDTFILNNIQNQLFVLRGYLNFIRDQERDPELLPLIGYGERASISIQDHLTFARQYRDMGAEPPRWQNVSQVLLFALSHLNSEDIGKDFSTLKEVELYSDALLENAFLAVLQNAILYRGPVHTLTGSFWSTERGFAVILEDDGRGVPLSDKETIFEKPVEPTLWSGLFLAREILSITDLTIVENGDPEKGGRFEISVPAHAFRYAGKRDKGD